MELLGIALYKQLFLLPKRCIVQARDYARLAEVGRLETPKLSGKYETGQLILHRVFGYRGVVLFPWLARVYDRDLPPTPRASGDIDDQEGGNSSTSNSSRGEVRGRTHLFYQVLIDQRDSPYIRAQTEAVTFLGGNGNNSSNQDGGGGAASRSLYAIPGLDYVAHEDIIPWTPSEQSTTIIGGGKQQQQQQQHPPLHHELFERFLRHTPGRDPPYVAQETLRAWHHKNHPWLELSDVHKETTEKVRVTVIPFYMGCRETHTHTPSSSPSNASNNTAATSSASNGTVYWWRYCIRLENLGPLTVQLRERHWRIFSLSGTLETVRGRGVVGQEPALTPHHAPAFQYSSHVSLQAPSGHMWGTFRLEREDGYAFDCRIPPFSLESKAGGGGNGTSTPPTGSTA